MTAAPRAGHGGALGPDSLTHRWLCAGTLALLAGLSRPVPAIVGAALLCLVLLTLDRAPLALLVYTVALVVIALGSANYFASKPRFLLPAFPLLLPGGPGDGKSPAAHRRPCGRRAGRALLSLRGIC